MLAPPIVCLDDLELSHDEMHLQIEDEASWASTSGGATPDSWSGPHGTPASAPVLPVALDDGQCEREGVCDLDVAVNQSMGSPSMSMGELTTFTGCEDLLRGVPLSVCLANLGSLFADSHGAKATWELSQSVDHIDAFLSHNWSVPRWEKFLALVFHYNLGLAVGTSVLALVLVFAISHWAVWLGWLPSWEEPGVGLYIGVYCRLTNIPIFVLALLFGRSFSFGRLRSPTVFLDKVCINQENKHLQRQGILKLPAFLAQSKRMVVLYSNLYLTRIWTVYEMAAYLNLRGVESMDVLPMYQVKLFYCLLLCVYPFQFLSALCRYMLSSYEVLYLVHFVGGLAFIHTTRRFHRERLAEVKQLSEFSIHRCNCFNESDRPVVYHNVVTLMRACNSTFRRASDEDVLDAFDSQVRSRMPAAFRRAFGQVGFSYRLYFAIGFLVEGGMVGDYMSGYLLGDDPPDGVVALWIYLVVLTSCLWPLNLMGLELVSAHCLHVTGGAELAYVFLGFVIAVVPFFAANSCFQVVLNHDGVSEWERCLLVGVVATPVALACWAASRQRHVATDEASSKAFLSVPSSSAAGSGLACEESNPTVLL